MKTINIILAVLGICVLFSNCTGVKSTSSGLKSEAYVVLIGDKSSYGDVKLQVDDNEPIDAEVTKESKRPKGKVYAISTGKHVIRVFNGDELIYQKQVFVSSQETKKIILQ
jgi:hypothetical protein